MRWTSVAPTSSAGSKLRANRAARSARSSTSASSRGVSAHSPWVSAFIAARFLPAAVRGPVDFSPLLTARRIIVGRRAPASWWFCHGCWSIWALAMPGAALWEARSRCGGR